MVDFMFKTIETTLLEMDFGEPARVDKPQPGIGIVAADLHSRLVVVHLQVTDACHDVLESRGRGIADGTAVIA